jgi:sensor histidine kinase YesM
MTKPIINLAHSAREMSKGNFNADDVEVSSQDELGIMANAFNAMKHSIKQYINELHNKADTESQLLEQQIENLKIHSLLADAEMKALQMQINPHFLFNTLSTGAQLAMLENADRACTFIEKAAELFRYNLRNLDNPVTINDEVTNVRNYIYLMQVRFGDKVDFNVTMDDRVADDEIPCMIMQPIVENAFVHGLGDMESGGRITVAVTGDDAHTVVSVKDNGKGMSGELIHDILSGRYERKTAPGGIKEAHKGHTNGIGINNIISRISLFYDRKAEIDILSNPMQGTEFILRLPRMKKAVDNVV